MVGEASSVPRRVDEVLTVAARRSPNEAGLIGDDFSYSFADLDARASGLAGWLQSRTDPGDRVAVVGDNHPAWIDAYYGVARAGRVLTPINHRIRPDEQAAQIQRVGATVLISDRARLEELQPHLDAIRYRVVMDEAEWDDVVGTAPLKAPVVDPSDIAWLLFTSGTTGTPKIAALAHRSLVAAIEGSAIGRPVRADDRYLFPFPLCHVAGHNVIAQHLAGRPVVLLARFRADAFVETVNAHRITSCSLAPTMLVALMDHLEATGATMPTLRSVGYGASPITPTLLRRIAQQLDVDLSQGYGMTETAGNVCFLDPQDHRAALTGDPRPLASAGRPHPGAQVKIIGPDGADVGPGGVGEIAVRGEQVFVGYWHDAAATRATLPDGWLRTGDMGHIDNDGLLFVTDRLKDVIVTGGENVASSEVESVLCELEGVADCAVVGVADDYWGEAVTALLVLKDGQTVAADEVIAHARSRLSGYKTPRYVFTVDRLPVNASGKVDKVQLRSIAAGLAGG